MPSQQTPSYQFEWHNQQVLMIRIGQAHSGDVRRFFNQLETLVLDYPSQHTLRILCDAQQSDAIWNPYMRQRVEILNDLAKRKNITIRWALVLNQSLIHRMMQSLVRLAVDLLQDRRIEMGIFCENTAAMEWASESEIAAAS
jgi:hypothetical protein